MERLLTTRDLQQILQVDRITVYRMLESGGLPGIKVRGQWRFPEQEVKNWLEGVKAKRSHSSDPLVRAVSGALAAPPAPEWQAQSFRLTDVVSTVCLQNIQDGFSEALGVASLVIDLQAMPLTALSNACAFCRLGRTSGEFRHRCSASWASLVEGQEEQPQVHLCHAGIGYAAAPVQVHGARIGMVVGGQFWSERPEPDRLQATASRLGTECDLEPTVLLEALESVPVFGQERVFLMTRVLATIANAVSEIGFQAYEVRRKLEQIAQIVKTL